MANKLSNYIWLFDTIFKHKSLREEVSSTLKQMLGMYEKEVL